MEVSTYRRRLWRRLVWLHEDGHGLITKVSPTHLLKTTYIQFFSSRKTSHVSRVSPFNLESISVYDFPATWVEYLLSSDPCRSSSSGIHYTVTQAPHIWRSQPLYLVQIWGATFPSFSCSLSMRPRPTWRISNSIIAYITKFLGLNWFLSGKVKGSLVGQRIGGSALGLRANTIGTRSLFFLTNVSTLICQCTFGWKHTCIVTPCFSCRRKSLFVRWLLLLSAYIYQCTETKPLNRNTHLLESGEVVPSPSTSCTYIASIKHMSIGDFGMPRDYGFIINRWSSWQQSEFSHHENKVTDLEPIYTK